MDPTSYSENRKTEIEWLEEIPKHWDIRRLKFMATIQNGRDYKHVECNGNGYPVYGSGGAFRIASEYLYDGESILFGRKGTIDKPLYVQGKFWTVDTMFYSEVLPETYGKFLYYSALTIQYDLLATQTALPSITQLDLDNYSLCFPPFKEQQQIAKFLDHKTGQIDQLIAKKKALIEKLDEKRIAVITQAVTKGLDPTAPMRDSEVEWLGEVPEHWEVRRLKECSELISKGTTPSTEGLQVLDQGKVRFIKAENIVRGFIRKKPSNFIDEYTNFVLRRSILQEGDILFVIAGATLGKVAFVTKEHLPANTNQAVAFVRPTQEVNTLYLYYWLQSYVIKEMTWLYAVQSAQPNLAMGVLGNFVTLLPSEEEQELIVEHISSEINKNQKMIGVTQKTIDRLVEYRTTLITAAVTGKIDVRNVKVPQEA